MSDDAVALRVRSYYDLSRLLVLTFRLFLKTFEALGRLRLSWVKLLRNDLELRLSDQTCWSHHRLWLEASLPRLGCVLWY